MSRASTSHRRRLSVTAALLSALMAASLGGCLLPTFKKVGGDDDAPADAGSSRSPKPNGW